MLFAGRPLETIEEDALQRVVLGASESDTVEFKRDIWGTGADERREMLRDISAFANHLGGEIYLGVEEDENATAVNLPGIAGTGQPERVLNSCRSNIEPPLTGLDVHAIPLANGNRAIIVRVPRSLAGPHMITFQGMHQFWKRYGLTKGAMTVQEIEDSFVSRMQAETKVERFLKQRLDHLYDSVGQARWLFLAATPMFLGRPILDVLSEEVESIFSYPPQAVRTAAAGSGQHMSHNYVRPSLHGLRGELRGRDGTVAQYAELHRTGHVEMGVNWIFTYEYKDEQRPIYATHVLEYSFNFVHLAKLIYGRASLAGPAVLKVYILNAGNSILVVQGRSWSGPDQLVTWEEPTLELPTVLAPDIVTTPSHAIVKQVNDALWNAFGLRECTYLDSDGTLSRESGLQAVSEGR